MTVEEIKSQLYELIDERKSLKSSGDCDEIDNAIYDKDIAALKAAVEAVQLVEDAANAEEPAAHWDINVDGYYPFCSHCGEAALKMSPHCPNCGYRMTTRERGGDDDAAD